MLNLKGSRKPDAVISGAVTQQLRGRKYFWPQDIPLT